MSCFLSNSLRLNVRSNVDNNTFIFYTKYGSLLLKFLFYVVKLNGNEQTNDNYKQIIKIKILLLISFFCIQQLIYLNGAKRNNLLCFVVTENTYWLFIFFIE